MFYTIRFFLLHLIMFLCYNANAQNWVLKKSTKDYNAYTKEREDSDVKSYKLVSTINASVDCIYNTMTDYEHYSEMFKEISFFEIIEKKQDTYITYTLFESLWPVQDRDLVSVIKITKSENKINIVKKALKEQKYKRKVNIVRLFDYTENCTLETISENETKFTLTGHYDAGGSIPAWVQNMYLINGVDGLVKILKNKCE